MVLYICSKFRENISKSFRDIERTQFPYINVRRGIIPSKMKEELRFLVSSHCLMVLYVCTKFYKNISKGFRVIEGT